MAIFAIFDQTTSEAKIRSRNDLKMVGTSFESSEFYFHKIFVLFGAFLEPKRYHQNQKINHTVLVPKRHKKVQNFYKNYFFGKYGLSAFQRRPNHL